MGVGGRWESLYCFQAHAPTHAIQWPAYKQNKTKHPQLGGAGVSVQKHASISLMNTRQLNNSANRFQEQFGHLLTKIKGGISEIMFEAKLLLDAEHPTPYVHICQNAGGKNMWGRETIISLKLAPCFAGVDTSFGSHGDADAPRAIGLLSDGIIICGCRLTHRWDTLQ